MASSESDEDQIGSKKVIRCDFMVAGLLRIRYDIMRRLGRSADAVWGYLGSDMLIFTDRSRRQIVILCLVLVRIENRVLEYVWLAGFRWSTWS